MNTASKTAAAPKQPSEEDWTRWCRRGHAPIWMASLLSLDILPRLTDRNKPYLTAHPDVAKEHKERCAVISVNYKKHPHLPVVDHKKMKGPFGAIINLKELCKYLLEINIFSGEEPMVKVFLPNGYQQDDINPKAKVMDRQPEAMHSDPRVIEPEPNLALAKTHPDVFGFQLAAISNTAQNSPSIVSSKMSEPVRGEKYMQATLGAVLIIIERLLNERPKHQCSFMMNGRINQKKLGEEVAAIIDTVIADGNKDVRSINWSGRSDHISKALKLLGN
jgi:hypothetical protein